MILRKRGHPSVYAIYNGAITAIMIAGLSLCQLAMAEERVGGSCYYEIIEDVRAGTIKTISIPVYNDSEQEIRIIDVKTSCSCSAPLNHGQKVAPGGTEKVPVQFTVGHGQPSYEHQVLVTTDSPTCPVFRVRLAGSVINDDGLKLSTQNVRLVTFLGADKRPSSEIEVSHATKDIAVVAVDANIPEIAASVVVRSPRRNVINVTGLPTSVAMVRHAVIRMRLKGAVEETIELPIVYQVKPRISAFPEALPLPQVKAESFMARFTFVANDGAPVVIAEAETPGITGLNIDWNVEDNGTSILVVKGNPVLGSAEGEVGLRVRFEGREDEVFVPYEGPR